MILIDLANWLWQRKGDVSILAVLGFIAHKWAFPYLMRKYRLNPDEDRIQWTIERVEKLTGEKYVGVTEKSIRMAQKNSRRLSRSLRAAMRRGYRLKQRRRKGMTTIDKKWIIGLLVYIAYFVKILTGVEIGDEMIDTVAEIVMLLSGLIPMIVNMIKNHNSKGGASQNVGDTQRTNTFESHK